jgi:hypothetical protein
LLTTSLIIGLLKTKLREIRGLLREVVRRFLLPGNVWILDGGYNTQMPCFLVRIRQKSATRLILSTKPAFTSFKMDKYIVRNTTIPDVKKSSLPGTLFAIIMPLRFSPLFIRN